MAPHSSTLAQKVPWMEEPGRLQSMGSIRVGPDRAPSLSLFTSRHWRRKWQPTPVFLPRESQGRGILVGCRLWGRTESDTTEVTQQQHQQQQDLRLAKAKQQFLTTAVIIMGLAAYICTYACIYNTLPHPSTSAGSHCMLFFTETLILSIVTTHSSW